MYRKFVDYYVSGFRDSRFMAFYAPTLFVALAFCSRLDTWSVFHRERVVARSVGTSVFSLDSLRFDCV